MRKGKEGAMKIYDYSAHFEQKIKNTAIGSSCLVETCFEALY